MTGDPRIVRWRWRRLPCAVCRCWLTRYWTAGRTCSWACEVRYAQRAGWI